VGAAGTGSGSAMQVLEYSYFVLECTYWLTILYWNILTG
jgi:hypothetical protein